MTKTSAKSRGFRKFTLQYYLLAAALRKIIGCDCAKLVLQHLSHKYLMGEFCTHMLKELKNINWIPNECGGWRFAIDMTNEVNYRTLDSINARSIWRMTNMCDAINRIRKCKKSRFDSSHIYNKKQSGELCKCDEVKQVAIIPPRYYLSSTKKELLELSGLSET